MKREYSKPMLPPIDIVDAKHGYFVHNGDIYSVSEAPDTVFRAAVLALAPHWLFRNDEHGALLGSEIDFYARWWLLCELADTDRPMPLHASREAAERSCSVPAIC